MTRGVLASPVVAPATVSASSGGAIRARAEQSCTMLRTRVCLLSGLNGTTTPPARRIAQTLIAALDRVPGHEDHAVAVLHPGLLNDRGECCAPARQLGVRNHRILLDQRGAPRVPVRLLEKEVVKEEHSTAPSARSGRLT